MTYEDAYAKLEKYGQLHVLKYYDSLTEEEKQALLIQIDELDFSVLARAKNPHVVPRGKISPIRSMELPEIDKNRKHYEQVGLEEIRAGKVAAVLLAGGMGTRLGSDDPKCMYDIGITHPVYIMQRLVENLQEVNEAAGTTVPFFIMTSEKNNDKTIGFMKRMNYFGYDPEKVFFFKQAMAPCSDENGKVYLEAKNRIATSPNGNGGWFLSMKKTGVLKIVKQLGIEWLNTFAVDNVLQRIADPAFIGAIIEHNCVTGAMVVRKNAPDERVGAMCLEDGRPAVVEYYEMTKELMEAKLDNGEPAYNFGVIMNYIFREDQLERIVDNVLPVHVVEKEIPYLDDSGRLIHPDKPNGYKYEQLVLDMVKEMGACLPFEVDREKAFAPIKNRTGIDSVESAREFCRLNGIKL